MSAKRTATGPRRWHGYTSEQVADHAWANLTCPDCGAEPKSACTPLPEPPRTVCQGRFVAAAMELKNQRKAKAPSPEAREAMARLDIATERGIFMADVPDADVAARLAGSEHQEDRAMTPAGELRTAATKLRKWAEDVPRPDFYFAVADWLEAAAEQAAIYEAQRAWMSDDSHALIVARAYLGVPIPSPDDSGMANTETAEHMDTHRGTVIRVLGKSSSKEDRG